jgi:hypothetical protein
MAEDEKTKQQTEAAVSTSVEQAVETKLTALRGETSKTDMKPAEAVETDVPQEKSVQTVAEQEKPVQIGAAVKPESSTLPASYRRAALARGWSTEEIDHYLELSPKEAETRFEGIFNSWQADNALWSERGRRLVGAGKAVDDKNAESEATELKPLDAKAIIERYGNDDLVNQLVPRLNEAIDKINKASEKFSQVENVAQDANQEALFNQTQSYLLSDEMKSFRDTYGTEVKTLTPTQVETRMKLFEEADIIIRGALEHGKRLSVHDALERAHSHLSHGQIEETVRSQIRESLQKRTKTLQSSKETALSAAKTMASNEPVSDEELERRTEQRLAALRSR